MPTGIGIVDLMLGIPSDDQKRVYDFMRPLFRDKESLQSFDFPVQYMFKDFPKVSKQEDYITYTLAAHGQVRDREGADRRESRGRRVTDRRCARTRTASSRPAAATRTRAWRGCASSCACTSTSGSSRSRRSRAATSRRSRSAAREWYPIFAKCVELDLPFNCCIGVPGPRIPMAAQHVEQLDEICWFFPELKFVMRHGAEPWCDLAVKLMLKWPNLYYSTSAFAPKHYPKAIIDYANTRGADKILYAGYFPAGLTLERIFGDMPNVPFRDARLAEVPARERRAGVQALRLDRRQAREGRRDPRSRLRPRVHALEIGARARQLGEQLLRVGPVERVGEQRCRRR